MIASGVARELDLGVVGEQAPSWASPAVGFDSDANRIANEAPSWLGNLVYAYGALRALVAWRPASFELVLDPRRARTLHRLQRGRRQLEGVRRRDARGARRPARRRPARRRPTASSIRKLRFLTQILPKVFKGTHVPRALACTCFVRRELEIAADRPFTLYADGDPIGELPRARRAAARGGAGARPSRQPARPPGHAGGHRPGGPTRRHRRCTARPRTVSAPARPQARTRAGGRRALAAARRRRHLGARQGAPALGAPRDRSARRAPATWQRSGLRDQRQDDHRGDGRRDPRAGRCGARPQPRRRQHGRGRRLHAARRVLRAQFDRRRARPVRGGRVLARPARRAAAPPRDPARQPLPRPARPLRRARIDRRALGARGPRGPGRDARLVLNADDPLVADLGRERAGAAGVLYFGVADDSLALPSMAHAADAKHCRNCGAPYVFDAVYLGHLGHYRCPACGQTRPAPDVFATDVRLEGVRAARFTLHTPAGEADVALPLPGLYNVYNALAAAALAHALDVPLERIVAGLQSTQRGVRPRGDRADRIARPPPRSAHPAHQEPRRRQRGAAHACPGAGRARPARAFSTTTSPTGTTSRGSGTPTSSCSPGGFGASPAAAPAPQSSRCASSTPASKPERIHVVPDLAAALAAAQAAAAGTASPLYALPTYTAMLSLRELLSAGGQTRSALSMSTPARLRALPRSDEHLRRPRQPARAGAPLRLARDSASALTPVGLGERAGSAVPTTSSTSAAARTATSGSAPRTCWSPSATALHAAAARGAVVLRRVRRLPAPGALLRARPRREAAGRRAADVRTVRADGPR